MFGIAPRAMLQRVDGGHPGILQLLKVLLRQVDAARGAHSELAGDVQADFIAALANPWTDRRMDIGRIRAEIRGHLS